MLNIGIENIQPKVSTETMMSIEELIDFATAVGIYSDEINQDFKVLDQHILAVENLTSVLDSLKEHGVTPALEALVGNQVELDKVSLENMITNGIKKVIDFIKGIIKKIKEFFTGKESISKLKEDAKRTVNELEKEIDNVKNDTTSHQITVTVCACCSNTNEIAGYNRTVSKYLGEIKRLDHISGVLKRIGEKPYHEQTPSDKNDIESSNRDIDTIEAKTKYLSTTIIPAYHLKDQKLFVKELPEIIDTISSTSHWINGEIKTLEYLLDCIEKVFLVITPNKFGLDEKRTQLNREVHSSMARCLHLIRSTLVILNTIVVNSTKSLQNIISASNTIKQ